MAKTKKFVPPKNLATCVDQLFKTREKRLEVEALVEEMKAEEKLLREQLIAELPKHEATGVAGKFARATLKKKLEPRVDTKENGWDLLYPWLAKNKAWDLLQKRLNESAVRERWEHGVKVPGVIAVEITTVSINKV